MEIYQNSLTIVYLQIRLRLNVLKNLRPKIREQVECYETENSPFFNVSRLYYMSPRREKEVRYLIQELIEITVSE